MINLVLWETSTNKHKEYERSENVHYLRQDQKRKRETKGNSNGSGSGGRKEKSKQMKIWCKKLIVIDGNEWRRRNGRNNKRPRSKMEKNMEIGYIEC